MDAPARRPDPPHETEWWRQGFIAALDGLDQDACPHAADAEAASWWLRGWLDGRNTA